MSSKKPYYEVIAERLIEQLEAGTAPFQKPWEPGAEIIPHNPVTGAKYKGSNALWLSMQGRSDPRWMTYKQAQSIDAQVMKGQKGTLIQYWKFQETVQAKDDNGKPIFDNEGKPVKRTFQLDRPKVFSAVVFNAEQISNLPELEKPEVNEETTFKRHERAEKILSNFGVPIHHDQADRAFYRPSTDSIHLPKKEQFHSPDRYYAVALHEIGHATGHESRLNRDLTGSFGSESYAREELRAEIASLMVGGELGIGHDPEQHAAYVNSWIKVLKDDPKEILRAAKDADTIKNHVLEHENQQANLNTVAATKLAEKFSEQIEDEATRQKFLNQVAERLAKTEIQSIKIREKTPIVQQEIDFER